MCPLQLQGLTHSTRSFLLLKFTSTTCPEGLLDVTGPCGKDVQIYDNEGHFRFRNDEGITVVLVLSEKITLGYVKINRREYEECDMERMWTTP